MPVLRLSATGPYVYMLQLALQRGGWLLEQPDGQFGPKTRTAVIALQRQKGLSPDGIVGFATWQALTPYLQGYTTHTIQPRDTFFTLAKRYGTTVAAIATANPRISAENLPLGKPLTIPFGYNLVPTNIPYTSALTQYIVKGLITRYPFILLSSIGNSVMGKPIHLLVLGNGNREISFNAAHHGNEWITTPVVLQFTEQYIKAYLSGEAIGNQNAQELWNRTRLYLVPMVNPDGVDLAVGAFTSGQLYARALTLANQYPSIPFPTGWKANIHGVDLNLQYPAQWEQAKQIKYSQGYTLPGPRDYVGSAPLTQPESIAMANFTRNHNFRLILAYHSQGELIYYKFQNYNPPNANEIGQALADASGYTLEVTPYNSGFAGYKDWFIQEYNRPGYTIEVGVGVNPLPIQQFPTIYNHNVGLMATALKLG